MTARFLKNRDGAAALETALVAPIIVAVLIGVVTYGGTILAYNRMRQAISSGAQYALTVEDNLTSVEAVVNAAWSPKPQGAIVTVTRQCFCADAPETATDCSVNCADGDYPRMYTKITGSMSYTGFGGDTSTLNASQKVRTR